MNMVHTIELWAGSGSAHGEEIVVFEHKLALVQGSGYRMSGRLWKDSECIAWSLRGSLIKPKWDFMFIEQNFHFSPLPLNFWICLHRSVSLPNQRLCLNRTVALSISLSLETNLFANGTTWAVVVFAVLGAHHCLIRSPNYWLCKGVAFFTQPPKSVCQNQIWADNLIICRGAPPFSMDLLLKWHAESFTAGFVVFFLRQHCKKLQPFSLEWEPPRFFGFVV